MIWKLSKIIRKPAAPPQPSVNTPWWQMQNGVFGYEVVVHHGYDGISPLTTRNVMPGLSRVTKATLASKSPQSWLSISEIDTGYSSRSSTFSLSEIDSNAGSRRSFGRGDVDDTPRAVDAASAVHKQTVRSWRSLSEIDSNTGSQRSGVTFGRRENVDNTLHIAVDTATAVDTAAVVSQQTDDTPHVAADTATAMDTDASAVSQQTDDAPKKLKRSRLLKELECTLNMDGYWKRGGPRRSTRISLQFGEAKAE